MLTIFSTLSKGTSYMALNNSIAEWFKSLSLLSVGSLYPPNKHLFQKKTIYSLGLVVIFSLADSFGIAR